jgi:threonine/homoserine/homoserine lactone efflux protein
MEKDELPTWEIGIEYLDLIGFALAVLLIELTPGPNMAWLAGLAATEGRRSGLAAVWGIGLGLLANGLLAAIGLAALLQAAPQFWTGLRLAGAAMMLWLAFDAWRGSNQSAATAPKVSSAGRAFATGAMINLLNPKAYVFFIVVAPQFLRGAALSLRGALILSLVSTAIATIIHLVIVLAGAKAHGWMNDPKRIKPIRRLFALVMVGVAISFVVADIT